MESVRLNKILSDAGVMSRRAADRAIEAGLVTVNGRKVYELGAKFDPNKDEIRYEGNLIKTAPKSKVYYLVNKPAGVLSSNSDPLGRPLVKDLVECSERIFPVGRLDWDSEGLIILTNDGVFAQAVAHPTNKIVKTYLVKVKGELDSRDFEKLKRGVTIPSGKAKFVSIAPHKQPGSSKYKWYQVEIEEGKNRQIRYMFQKVGCDVIKLQRVGIGQLTLGKLKKGESRKLTVEQLKKVFKPLSPYRFASKRNQTKGNSVTRKYKGRKA